MKNPKNYSTFIFLKSQDYSLYDILCFLMQANNISQITIAEKLKVSRQFVKQVLIGQRKTSRVKKAISKALGFNPWAF